MPDDVEPQLQQEIMRKTLDEVVHEKNTEEAKEEPCVICLDTVAEPAIAIPCKHANFDFLCLLSWVEQRPSCPLCKSDVTVVRYDLAAAEGAKTYKVPPPVPATSARDRRPSRLNFRRGGGRPRHTPLRPRQPEPDDPLLRRRHVYRNQLYSLRVGSNRLSQYRELTPELFNRDEQLVSRARKWIRRELRVFSFLNPDPDPEDTQREEGGTPGRVPRPGQQRLENRRGNNAEFLLEYVIAILRTVDVKGSAGQAEELLRDFLGRDNARLFLHELQSWLRSPYTSLEDWDRNVQYEDTRPDQCPRVHEPDPRRDTPVYERGGRSFRGRVYKPYCPRPHGPRDALAQERRLQYARDRYIPD